MYLVLIYTCFSSSDTIENGLGFLTVESKSGPFEMVIFFVFLVPVWLLLSSTVVLCHMNGYLQRAYSYISLIKQLATVISLPHYLYFWESSLSWMLQISIQPHFLAVK